MRQGILAKQPSTAKSDDAYAIAINESLLVKMVNCALESRDFSVDLFWRTEVRPIPDFICLQHHYSSAGQRLGSEPGCIRAIDPELVRGPPVSLYYQRISLPGDIVHRIVEPALSVMPIRTFPFNLFHSSELQVFELWVQF